MGLLTDSILFDAVAFFITLILFAYYHFSVSTDYWNRRGVPQLKPTFPTGNVINSLLQRCSIGEEFGNFYRQLNKEPFGGVYRFTEPVLLLKDPELIKHFLAKDFMFFHDKGININEKTDPLAGNLNFVGGARWKNLRTKLSPTFTPAKVKMMFSVLEECGQILIETVSNLAANNEELEIREILARYSTDVIASAAFGIQGDCLRDPDPEFRRWGKKMLAPVTKRSLVRLIRNIPIVKRYITFAVVPPDVTQFFTTLITNTIEYREKNNIVRQDFLQLLMQLKNQGYVEDDYGNEDLNTKKDIRKMTVLEVAAQAFVFFFAGFETSSTVIGFCLLELAWHPDIQTELQREIDDSLKKNGGKITYDGVMEMKYLDMVVSETLRKYPVAPILQRMCTRDYQIPNTDVVIKRGTSVVVPVYGIHRDEKYYENPSEFNPERFNKEEKAKRNQYMYMPFGEGPRICIGMRFALMQVKVALASLLAHYTFIRSERMQEPIVYNPKASLLTPIGGMWVKITNRTVA